MQGARWFRNCKLLAILRQAIRVCLGFWFVLLSPVIRSTHPQRVFTSGQRWGHSSGHLGDGWRLNCSFFPHEPGEGEWRGHGFQEDHVVDPTSVLYFVLRAVANKGNAVQSGRGWLGLLVDVCLFLPLMRWRRPSPSCSSQL